MSPSGSQSSRAAETDHAMTSAQADWIAAEPGRLFVGGEWCKPASGRTFPTYNPATGEWRSWRPEGERPRVYAVYVDDRDIVWISDFGANATLSFDPATERWTRYPGSGDTANVRQILGIEGRVYVPESSLDRIMIVRTDTTP